MRSPHGDPAGEEGLKERVTVWRQYNPIVLYYSRRVIKKCVDDDIYVSDQGCGIYNDARGQQFLREQRYV